MREELSCGTAQGLEAHIYEKSASKSFFKSTTTAVIFSKTQKYTIENNHKNWNTVIGKLSGVAVVKVVCGL